MGFGKLRVSGPTSPNLSLLFFDFYFWGGGVEREKQILQFLRVLVFFSAKIHLFRRLYFIFLFCYFLTSSFVFTSSSSIPFPQILVFTFDFHSLPCPFLTFLSFFLNPFLEHPLFFQTQIVFICWLFVLVFFVFFVIVLCCCSLEKQVLSKLRVATERVLLKTPVFECEKLVFLAGSLFWPFSSENPQNTIIIVVSENLKLQ